MLKYAYLCLSIHISIHIYIVIIYFYFNSTNYLQCTNKNYFNKNDDRNELFLTIQWGFSSGRKENKNCSASVVFMQLKFDLDSFNINISIQGIVKMSQM